MNTRRATPKILVLAAALAAGVAATAYADDNSMSLWTGDSYRYFNGGENFPYGKPVLDGAPSQFRATNPNGLSNAQYAALSSEDPVWQPVAPSDPGAQREAAAQALAWRQQNPHGLTDREYEALSANSSVWQLPDTANPPAPPSFARLRENFARLFGNRSAN